MCIGGVDLRLREALLVGVVARPRPGQDRPLRVNAEHVRPGLAVAVPQLASQQESTQRPPGDPAHDQAPWQVEDDHGVRPCPDDVLHRGVVVRVRPHVSVGVRPDVSVFGELSRFSP